MPTPCTCDTFTGNLTVNGNLGVGTSAPLAALDVNAATAPQLIVRGGATSSIRVFPTGGALSSLEAFATTDPSLASGYNRVRLTTDGAAAYLIADASGSGNAPMPLSLQAGGAERLRVATSGNVGIGTASPTQLHLQSGSLYINGGNVLYSGDATFEGRYYCVGRLLADSAGCYYAD